MSRKKIDAEAIQGAARPHGDTVERATASRSRDHKEAMTVWLQPGRRKALKRLAVEEETTVERLVDAALADMLEGKGMDR